MKRTWFMLLLEACSSGSKPPAREEAEPARIEVTEKSSGEKVGMPPVRVPAGRVFARASMCGRDPSTVPAIEYAEQDVPAFELDYDTVDCEDVSACVDAGRCPSAGKVECSLGKAHVRWETAHAFCQQREARLPTFAEWHRAVRQDRKDDYVTPTSGDCAHPTEPASKDLSRCQFVSELGVKFALDNPNMGEWTSDVDCLRDKEVHVSIYLIGRQLGRPLFWDRPMEFRCARGVSK